MEASKTSSLVGPSKFARCQPDDQQSLVQGRNIAATDALPGDSCEFGYLTITSYYAVLVVFCLVVLTTPW
uniref:Uncharacterized protein n=1 Tax=Trichogramma kaykai TaxID=54128 RepID=A0ABD2WI22_9HYME